LVIWHGDVREALTQFPDESVQCVVTSPPYLGQRSYLPDDHPDKALEIGFGQSLGDYVATMVDVFREVRRVLRKDGVLFLNLGDKRNYSGGAGGDYAPGGRKEDQPKFGAFRDPSLKPKDLMLVPARAAIALQEDGWYLRSAITWVKGGTSRESVMDRPADDTEMIYLFSKSQNHYFDRAAVPEARLNWWQITPEQSSEGHHARFPEEIPKRAILLGTSPMACPKCGAPWRRVWERTGFKAQRKPSHHPDSPTRVSSTGWQPARVPTDRFEPGCSCTGNDGSARCWVLDPFLGSGTTAAVALALGRAAIGVELNGEYIEQIAKRRLCRTQTTLLGML